MQIESACSSGVILEIEGRESRLVDFGRPIWPAKGQF